MRASVNERLTRIGPDTACGRLLRHYWQPVALLDEFSAHTDPRMAQRPLKALRILGEDLVLMRGANGRFGLLARHCPHRGADLAYGRHEGDSLRCPFHGWRFDLEGKCLETPAEPAQSRLCEGIRQTAYPVVERAGVLYAWMGGPDRVAEFDAYECFAAPPSHQFAYKGLWRCNWLQAMEVGIDPAHTSFLHRYLEDAPLETVGSNAAGRQFRSASLGVFAGESWPMSRIMRCFHRPEITFDEVPWGFRIRALRRMSDDQVHVRLTHGLFPQGFCIPLSSTMTITQWHVPVDDTCTYWYAVFTSYGQPLDHDAMRSQRERFIPPPDYIPLHGRHNHWGYNPEEQASRTFLGMGEDDINVHDQWAVESMGAIQDRTREHLATTDRVIIANRRRLLQAIDEVDAGRTPPGFRAQGAGDPHWIRTETVDGIAPWIHWKDWLEAQIRARDAGTPWITAMAG